MRVGPTIVAAGLIVLGCTGGDNSPDREALKMTTLETQPTELKPIEKPPQIEFDQSAPPPELVEGDEQEGATVPKGTAAVGLEDLPFSPKIAMDPIDGSKLSIRSDTPIAEYKGRIYYFSSKANRMEFIRNPEEYLSGTFASY